MSTFHLGESSRVNLNKSNGCGHVHGSFPHDLFDLIATGIFRFFFQDLSEPNSFLLGQVLVIEWVGKLVRCI